MFTGKLMDEGRIAGTSDIWDAMQLHGWTAAARLDWECPGCELPVYPAAWKLTGYKVPAHFKKKPETHHHPRCLYDLLCTSKRNGLTANRMGMPRGWVDRITFPTHRALPLGLPVKFPIRRKGPPALVSHSTTRHSINAACQFHHVVKGRRKDWPLRVDGVLGCNYFDVFGQARQPPGFDAEARIWFSQLRMSEQPAIADNAMTFVLNDRMNVSGEDRQVIVDVDWSVWSSDQRQLFVDRLTKVRSAAQWSKGWTPDAPVIYVLGSRTLTSPERILLNHPRKFAIVIPS